jgi:hypothetical protein
MLPRSTSAQSVRAIQGLRSLRKTMSNDDEEVHTPFHAPTSLVRQRSLGYLSAGAAY